MRLAGSFVLSPVNPTVSKVFDNEVSSYADLSFLEARHVRPLDKPTAPCWSSSLLIDGHVRMINANVATATAAVIDIEAGKSGKVQPDLSAIKDAFAGYSFLIHETTGHTEEAPRYRLILPYEREILPEVHKRVYAAIRSRLASCGVPTDAACSSARHLFLRPEPGSWCGFSEGRLLGPADFTTDRAQTAIATGAPRDAVIEAFEQVFTASGPLDLGAWASGRPVGSKVRCFCPKLDAGDRGSESAWVRRFPGGVMVFCEAEHHGHPPGLRCWIPDSASGANGRPRVDPALDALLEWKSSSKGVPLFRKPTKYNLDKILTLDASFANRLSHDAFKDAVILDGEPLTDNALFGLQRDVEYAYSVTYSKDEFVGGVESAARNRSFNPLIDDINAEVWDGVVRIDTLLCRNGAAADTEINRKMLRYWILQAVDRALHPGCKGDYTLVLQGPGGCLKSSFFRAFASAPYFSETHFDLHHRSTNILIASAWIHEIAEFTSFRRADNELTKNFLTRQHDTFVKPYEKFTTVYQRRCSFGATANDHNLLTDVNTNRRYLIIPITSRIDVAYVAENRLQILAEARAALAAGEIHYFPDADKDDKDVKAIEEVQALYMVDRPFEREVQTWIKDNPDIVFAVAADVLRHVGVDRATPTDLNAISAAFSKFRWGTDKIRLGDVTIRIRTRPCPPGTDPAVWGPACRVAAKLALEPKQSGNRADV